MLFGPHSPSKLEARYLYHTNIRRESRMRRSQIGRHKYKVRVYRLRYKEWMARETNVSALPPIFSTEDASVLDQLFDIKWCPTSICCPFWVYYLQVVSTRNHQVLVMGTTLWEAGIMFLGPTLLSMNKVM